MTRHAGRRRLATAALAVAAVVAGHGGAVAATAAENLPPRQPVAADLLTEGKECAEGVDRPVVRVAPTVRATLYDQLGQGQTLPDTLSAQFELWWRDDSGVEQRKTYTTPGKRSGDFWTLRFPSDIPAETVISWRVRADDGRALSPWSDEGDGPACEFVYDRTPPEKPVVVAPDFPDDTVASGGAGRYATFTVDSPSDEVVSYMYHFIGGVPVTVRPDVPGGPVAIRHLPLKWGVNTLSVQAYDRAGNGSDRTTFSFKVNGPDAPVARWTLADAAGSTAASAVTGPAARAGTGVTFGATGPSGTPLTSVVRLDGSGHGFLTPDASVIDTTKTFAVGAWVRSGQLEGTRTIASQDAGAAPGFTLGSRVEDGAPVWSFAFGGARVSGGDPDAGEWNYVLGQYDAETGLLRLTVNGRDVGTEQRATAVASPGAFQIGRARGADGYRERWQGEIGDVRVFDRVVVPEEVTALPLRKAKELGHWALESASDGLAQDTHGGAPLVLGPGTSIYSSPFDALVGRGHLELDGVTGFAATDRPVVGTDESFTVAAVFRLADSEPDRPMTVLSQGGTNTDAFKVRYEPSTSQLQLVMSHADEQGAEETVLSRFAMADGGQGIGHTVAVVHDEVFEELRLYVDGEGGQGDSLVTFDHAWKSTGPLQVGRGRTADGWGEYLHGAVDEVRVFSGTLSARDLPGVGFGHEPCFC